MLTGFCFAVLYVVIESGLNERASNENRGIIFSTYAMITLTVMAAGQMMTFAVAYTNDFAGPGEYVTVSGGLLLLYGVGATIGPFLASALMTLQQSSGLFLFTAIVHMMLISYVTLRFLRRRKSAEQHIAFGDALSATQTASQVFEEDIHPQSADRQAKHL